MRRNRYGNQGASLFFNRCPRKWDKPRGGGFAYYPAHAQPSACAVGGGARRVAFPTWRAQDKPDKRGYPAPPPRRSNVQNEVLNWLGHCYNESQVLFTSNLSTNSALMVQQGLAYSLVVEGSLPFWDREKIAFRPFSPELRANSVFMWKKQQPFSLAATKFIEHLRCFLGITQS
jgi:hypothetical protein